MEVLDLSKPVKYKDPIDENEKEFRFTVVSYMEIPTPRVCIELICDLLIKPQEIVSINDVVNA